MSSFSLHCSVVWVTPPTASIFHLAFGSVVRCHFKQLGFNLTPVEGEIQVDKEPTVSDLRDMKREILKAFQNLVLNCGKLSLILVTFAFVQNSHTQDDTTIVLAERTWQLANGKSIVAALHLKVNEDGSQSFLLVSETGHTADVSIATPYFGRSGGMNYERPGSGLSALAPSERAWIEDAWDQLNQSKSKHILDPASYVDPAGLFARNQLLTSPREEFGRMDTTVAALTRFGLWWHETGYLRISSRDNIESVTGDLERSLSRHITGSTKYRFDEMREKFSTFLDREYDVPVFASFKEIKLCSRERLAYYCNGRNATMLRVTKCEKGRIGDVYRLALLEAAHDGSVTLEGGGELLQGRLQQVDLEDRWWKRDPGKGSHEIILNDHSYRFLLELGARDERGIIGAPKGDPHSLWVIRPHVLTDNRFLKADPPPISPPPVLGAEVMRNATEKLATLVPEERGSEEMTTDGFDLRSEWNPLKLQWADRAQPGLRKWTGNDGKTMEGIFRSLDFRTQFVEVAVGRQSAFLHFSDLSGQDRAYSVMAGADQAPPRIKSGRYLYECRGSKHEAILLDLRFGPNFAIASWSGFLGEKPKEETIKGASEILLNAEKKIRIDYDKLQYFSSDGFSGQIERDEFARFRARVTNDPDLIAFYTSAEFAEHRGFPCRKLDLSKSRELGVPTSAPYRDRFHAAMHTLSAKVSRMGPPEASFFWRYLIQHPDFEAARTFNGLIQEISILGFIPVDISCKLDKREKASPLAGALGRGAYRIQLLDVQIDEIDEIGE